MKEKLSPNPTETKHSRLRTLADTTLVGGIASAAVSAADIAINNHFNEGFVGLSAVLFAVSVNLYAECSERHLNEISPTPDKLQ